MARATGAVWSVRKRAHVSLSLSLFSLGVCVCVRVCVCVSACACACVHVCVYACVLKRLGGSQARRRGCLSPSEQALVDGNNGSVDAYCHGRVEVGVPFWLA